VLGLYSNEMLAPYFYFQKNELEGFFY